MLSYILNISDTTSGATVGQWHLSSAIVPLQLPVEGLTAQHVYNCSVAAANEFGQGPAASVLVLTAPPNLPPPPDGVRGVAVGNGAVEVVWSPVNWVYGPVTYAVSSITSSGTSGPQVLSVIGASVWVDGLVNGTSYFFSVAAVTDNGSQSAASLRSP